MCRLLGLALNGGNKPAELGLLALHQLLAKLILRLKGLFSPLLALLPAHTTHAPANRQLRGQGQRLLTGSLKGAVAARFSQIKHEQQGAAVTLRSAKNNRFFRDYVSLFLMSTNPMRAEQQGVIQPLFSDQVPGLATLGDNSRSAHTQKQISVTYFRMFFTLA